MIRPLAKRLLVDPTKAAEEKSGLIIPDAARERPQSGEVVAAGAAASIVVGAVVLFAKYSGTKIHDDGHDYLIVDERDVIAVLA